MPRQFSLLSLTVVAGALAIAACDRAAGPAMAQVAATQASSSSEAIPLFDGAELTADETARRYVSTATPEEVFLFYRDHFAKQEGVVASTHPYPLSEPHHAMGVAISPERQRAVLEAERPTRADGSWLETAGFQWTQRRPDGKTVEFNLTIQDDGMAEDWSAYTPRTLIDLTSVLRP